MVSQKKSTKNRIWNVRAKIQKLRHNKQRRETRHYTSWENQIGKYKRKKKRNLESSHLPLNKILGLKNRDATMLHTIIYLILLLSSIKAFICTLKISLLQIPISDIHISPLLLSKTFTGKTHTKKEEEQNRKPEGWNWHGLAQKQVRLVQQYWLHSIFASIFQKQSALQLMQLHPSLSSASFSFSSDLKELYAQICSLSSVSCPRVLVFRVLIGLKLNKEELRLKILLKPIGTKFWKHMKLGTNVYIYHSWRTLVTCLSK